MLAGGSSRRFGEADKLAAVYGGMPLLHHAVLRLAEITGDVVVTIAPGVSEPTMPPGAPVRFARDAREGEGPLAGAAAGLAAVDRDLTVIAGGDMPELSTAVVFHMLEVALQAEVDAVALQHDDRFRPLPVVVRTRASRDAAHALLHGGERSLRVWLQALRLAVIDEPTWTALDPTRATMRDVDVPGDLDPH
ncbi:MAG TPA: NTP transferase domain-containing protein [Actinomycetota bacterium]